MRDATAQSQKTIAGDKLEKVTIQILNEFLLPHNIVVLKETKKALKTYFESEEIALQIIDFNKLPVKRPCDQRQLEDYPDTDLFVLFKQSLSWRVLGLISCKVSLHSRHTMVTFGGLSIRISSNISYVCVTEDADIYRSKRSELGISCSQPTSTRRLLESFTDGIYTIKNYKSHTDKNLVHDLKSSSSLLTTTIDERKYIKPHFDDSSIPYHTQYCESVRPFDDLVFQILRWKEKFCYYSKNGA